MSKPEIRPDVNWWMVDAKKNQLYGYKPADDRPLSDCVVPVPDGPASFNCYVTDSDSKLKIEKYIIHLEEALRGCQSQ